MQYYVIVDRVFARNSHDARRTDATERTFSRRSWISPFSNSSRDRRGKNLLNWLTRLIRERRNTIYSCLVNKNTQIYIIFYLYKAKHYKRYYYRLLSIRNTPWGNKGSSFASFRKVCRSGASWKRTFRDIHIYIYTYIEARHIKASRKHAIAGSPVRFAQW